MWEPERFGARCQALSSGVVGRAGRRLLTAARIQDGLPMRPMGTEGTDDFTPGQGSVLPRLGDDHAQLPRGSRWWWDSELVSKTADYLANTRRAGELLSKTA